MPPGGPSTFVLVGVIDECRVQRLPHLLPVEKRVAFRQQNTRHDVVLDQPAQWGAVRGYRVLLVRSNNLVRLGPREVVLGEVEVHLVAVKVGVVRLAVGVVHSDGPLAG